MTETQLTSEQRAELARQQREAAESVRPRGQEGQGFFGFIKQFLDFFFNIFLKGNDAPEEEVDNSPEARNPAARAAAMVRAGRKLIDSNAVPNWTEFKRAHGSETVTHISPVAGEAAVTSELNHHRVHPISGRVRSHNGADLGARGSNRTPDIMASADGVVLFSGRQTGYGNTVIIGHADGSMTLYAHMSGENMPRSGSTVAQGAVIGVMGSTGGSTGIHLHYEQIKDGNYQVPLVNNVRLNGGTRLNGGVATAAATPANQPVATQTPAAPAATPPKSPAVESPLQVAQREVQEALDGGMKQIRDARDTLQHATTSVMSNLPRLPQLPNLFQRR